MGIAADIKGHKTSRVWLAAGICNTFGLFLILLAIADAAPWATSSFKYLGMDVELKADLTSFTSVLNDKETSNDWSDGTGEQYEDCDSAGKATKAMGALCIIIGLAAAILAFKNVDSIHGGKMAHVGPKYHAEHKGLLHGPIGLAALAWFFGGFLSLLILGPQCLTPMNDDVIEPSYGEEARVTMAGGFALALIGGLFILIGGVIVPAVILIGKKAGGPEPASTGANTVGKEATPVVAGANGPSQV